MMMAEKTTCEMQKCKTVLSVLTKKINSIKFHQLTEIWHKSLNQSEGREWPQLAAILKSFDLHFGTKSNTLNYQIYLSRDNVHQDDKQ